MGNRETISKTRRGIVKSVVTAGITGVSFSKMGAASARPNENGIAQSRFLEVSLEHRNAPHQMANYRDGFAPYQFSNDGRAIMTHSMDGRKDRRVRQMRSDRPTISTGTEFHEAPKSLFGETNKSLRRYGDSTLTLEEEYESPTVDIDYNREKSVVEINGVKKDLGSREKIEITLPDQEVVVNQPNVVKDTGERTREYEIVEERKPVRKTVTPTVEVQDYGSVSMHENRRSIAGRGRR